MNFPIRLFIFEDMLSFTDGFKMYVDSIDHIMLVDSADSVEKCLAKTRNKLVDVILLDIKIKENAWAGFTVAKEIIARFKEGRDNPSIIFLSGYPTEEYINRAKSINCSFFDKYLSMPKIVAGIEEVHKNKQSIILIGEGAIDEKNKARELALKLRRSLTPRQGQVTINLYFHRTNDEIALELGIKKSSVETHLKRAYQTLGLNKESNCREQLKKMIYESGLIHSIDKINKDPKKWFKKKERR